MPLPFLEGYSTPTPVWLRRLTPACIEAGPEPWLDRIAGNALVYPGSGTDGSPVRALNGVVHSFVFMDYLTDPAEVLDEATRPRRVGTGFAHHRLVGLSRFDPTPILALAPKDAHHPGASRWGLQAPWGLWAVYEDLRPGRKGERFSFLFLGVEAHAAIAALHPRRPPLGVVCVEHGFGANCYGSHAEPLEARSRQWEAPPELLVTGDNWSPPWHDRLQEIGVDRALESMHRSNRTFHRVRRLPGEPPAVVFREPDHQAGPIPFRTGVRQSAPGRPFSIRSGEAEGLLGWEELGRP